MLPDLLAALALAFPIVDGSPEVAGPCPGYYEDLCEDIARWSSLQAHNAAKIPSDGVLVLQGFHEGPWDEAAATTVEVEVEVTLAAQPIAGTLELGPVEGVLVWRPDAPWTPGATYEFSVMVPDTDGPDSYCVRAFETGGALIVDTEPGAALEVPVLDAVLSTRIYRDIGLASMACCEGEAPALVPGRCGYAILDWDLEVCAPIRGTGYLRVDFTGEPAAEGPAAQQIVYTRKVDGLPDLSQLRPIFRVELPGPYCVEIEARDLASGELTTTGQLCHGDDIADQLGPQTLAPPETLTCPLRRCEPTDLSWDLERCMPYGPQPDEAAKSGCDCDVEGAGGTDLLGLIGLLALIGLVRPWRAR